MSIQQELEAVYENGEDALRAAVQALGGAKTVAHRLWPAKPLAEGQRDLLDALNTDRLRKLEFGEILHILRWACDAGFHSAKRYVDAETGYGYTDPVKPADELAELQRQYIESVRMQLAIADRLERLTQPPLQAVK